MITGVLFFYFGLKEASMEKPRERETKKEVQVRESLFRLYERPDYITEEEVSFHKERKICLVCKNDVARLNYICPKCSALYCTNCSEQLSDLENMCWVCDEPFDETKPIRPQEKKKPKNIDDNGKA
jgi:late competence protein required for DNA uptake (superfamily II DNA/RNA helicase)